ncbi:uncharacterized protein RHOBADRAFT_53726 [Rhodotorula graminis WP1]|uniref:Major facilitator superfamily (MFS) profile domain-containing protein n=1 Tax=Rhodotorula graminis (strain WP1) TaxID=578459 RepID=A0A194S228_RHOGW|nr:uncharacterized protein RHOBADRAFT_53726 [Rhodotorula graminis WP1]KPV74788.1 hypothetical protein RHOBADRAFT_53726 [Rhodotorula graminis WP1]
MSEVKHTHEHVEHAMVHDSYAVDKDNTPVTVLGTMGQDPDHAERISWRTWFIVALCALAQMQNTFISVAPAAAAYSIAGALGGSTGQRIWIIQAASVPSIVTGPIFAIISDVYGRRYLIIIVWLIFCASAIVGMTATSMNALIGAQVAGGMCMGISGIMYGLAGEIMPSVYRAWSQTIVNTVACLASVIALIGMGSAIQNDPIDGWRWIWRTALIMNGVLFLGFAFFYFPPPRTISNLSLWGKVRSLDWTGYFLLISGLVPLLMGLAWSSDPGYGWHDMHSYVPVAIGCAGLVACGLYEWRGTKVGFIHHKLFENGRNFPLALFLVAVEGAIFYEINNIYPAEVNALWAPPGSLEASAKLLPFFLILVPVAPFMGWYVTKTKDLKWPLCAGFLLFGAATVGLAMSGLNSAAGVAWNGVAGLGFCAPLILLMSVVQLSTPPLFIGVASALVISVRTLGGSVGYAIASAIYGALTNDQIPANILKAVVPLGFDPSNIGALIVGLTTGQGIATIPGATGQVLGAASAALKETEVHGYKIVWFVFLPGCIIAAIGSAFLVNPRERMNWVVDAPLNAHVPIDGSGAAENGESAETASQEKA